MKHEFLGDWYLDGYSFVETGVGPGVPPDPADVENWLLAVGRIGWPEVEARAGLELTLWRDGSYSERAMGGRQSMLWDDSDGVQTDSPEPTEGAAREVTGRAGGRCTPVARRHWSLTIRRGFETSCVMMMATRRLPTFSITKAVRSSGPSRS
jgi:hypothetical protein